MEPAAEGGVEVDEVHPLGAVALPLQRGLDRVAVRRLAAGLALHQPDGLAVGDVDGGQQLEASPVTSGSGSVRDDDEQRQHAISGDDDAARGARSRSAPGAGSSSTVTSQPAPSTALSRRGSGACRRCR